MRGGERKGKMYEKLLRKVVNTLINISNLINCIATKIQELSLREEFYVYVPSANKPRIKHSTFRLAEKEAYRLQEIVAYGDDIEILQVVKKIKGSGVPF